MAEENGKKEKSKFKFNQLFTTIIVVLAVFFAAVFAATIFFIKVVLPQRNEYMMLSEANQVKYMVPLGEILWLTWPTHRTPVCQGKPDDSHGCRRDPGRDRPAQTADP